MDVHLEAQKVSDTNLDNVDFFRNYHFHKIAF